MRRFAAFPHTLYFLLLGLAVSAAAAAIVVAGHWGAFERKSFDLFMQARLRAPAPDPAIVLVDIDEHSLNAMAADYGRWPWPRRVIGEFIEAVEAQQPRAVVLDILFADPDLHNPDSEAAFDAAVRRAPHVFYTAARLPPQFDAASALTADRVPGVVPPAGPGAKAPTVAMILPYLDSILKGGRIGTSNLLPDRDGVAREAFLYHHVGGWRIPSVAAAVAAKLTGKPPAGDRVVLNWRGPAGTYPHVSFSDVYLDTLRRTPTRPRDEFHDKIVFVGSSAAGLFDLRPTPVSQVHPGTEILATALDNVLRDDHIRRAPEWLVAVLTSVFVMGLAWTFAFNHNSRISDRAFVVLQVVVGLVAFAALHVAPVYIDASASITFGTAYFTLARISQAWRDRARAALLRQDIGAGPMTARILWVGGGSLTKRNSAALRRLLENAAARSRFAVARLSPPSDSLGLFERALGAEAGLAWVLPSDDGEAASRAEIEETMRRIEAWATSRSVRFDCRIASAIIPSDLEQSDLRQVFASLFAAQADGVRELE